MKNDSFKKYFSGSFAEQSACMNFLSLAHGYALAEYFLFFSKLLDIRCRVRAHAQETNHWRLWTRFFVHHVK